MHSMINLIIIILSTINSEWINLTRWTANYLSYHRCIDKIKTYTHTIHVWGGTTHMHTIYILKYNLTIILNKIILSKFPINLFWDLRTILKIPHSSIFSKNSPILEMLIYISLCISSSLIQYVYNNTIIKNYMYI